MITTDAQVKKLMEELQKGATQEVAGLRAGMGRKAAAKYARLGKLPSELKEPRTWRTRPDPFSGDRACKVLFTPAYRLVQRLLVAKRALALERELRALDAFDVVAIDDIGYIQQDREE